MRNFLIIVLVALLGFLLRINKVTEIPPSLNWDEVSIGYNAYSILKTGKDEWNSFLPLHFRSFGEYKLPAQIYASIPGIAFFGLNAFGVRITPVVYGTLTVLLSYFVAKEIFSNKKIGVFTAFLMATSVWHIQLTRASFESSFSLFWVLLGVWFLVRGFNTDKRWWIVSAVPFAIAVYTYNSARFFVPIFLLITAAVYQKEILKFKNYFLLAGGLFLILLLPLVPFVLSGEGSARYELVSITTDPGLVPRIEERRNESELSGLITNLIHNRPVYISYYFAKNYLSHFSPQFLFLRGAEHKHHHVQGIGELFWIQAPFLVIGAYLLFKDKSKYRWILIIWLVISIIPAATTRDTIPHALRTLIALPVFQLISAYGLYKAYKYLKDKKRVYQFSVWSLVIFVFMFQFSLYLFNYYFIYPFAYSREWQYGYKQVYDFIEPRITDYDRIVVTRHYGEPHIFALFYLQYPPDSFQTDPNLKRYQSHDWVWVESFGKFLFPDLGDEGTKYQDIINKYPNEDILVVGKPGDFPTDANIVETFYFLDGKPVFEIVEVK